MRAIVLAAALLVAARPAAAEPRSIKTAFTLSGVGTGVSSALFFSAFVIEEGDVNMPLVYAGLGTLLVTPSLGQFYAERYLTLGLSVRAAAAALALYAVIEYRQTERCPTELYMECTTLTRGAVPLLGIAAIAYVGGAALDFKELPDSVTAWNRRRGFMLSPVFVPAAQASGGMIGVAGTF